MTGQVAWSEQVCEELRGLETSKHSGEGKLLGTFTVQHGHAYLFQKSLSCFSTGNRWILSFRKMSVVLISPIGQCASLSRGLGENKPIVIMLRGG